ncbi:MAG TPA: GrpB family protein [Anaerolineaceae bacterium]|nr:GrpB family protein [Anaerolineaceae bacterium]
MSAHIPVEVVPYDPLWPHMFSQESQRILALIAPYVQVIEHMGSTAVPGLAAKPVIDILIGVHRLSDDRFFLPPLADLGYTYVPEHETVFPERRYLHRIVDGRHTHHLHMVKPASEFFRVQLRFRDILRAHPEEAARYAALKYDLAARFHDDREAYTNGKSDLITAILERHASEDLSGLYNQ